MVKFKKSNFRKNLNPNRFKAKKNNASTAFDTYSEQLGLFGEACTALRLESDRTVGLLAP